MAILLSLFPYHSEHVYDILNFEQAKYSQMGWFEYILVVTTVLYLISTVHDSHLRLIAL